MIKAIFLSMCMSISFIGFAQDIDRESIVEKGRGSANNNELKINVFSSIFGLPELTYENIINKNGAIGISVAIATKPEIDLNFLVLPYYRYYLGKKPGAGFFIEANAAVYSEDDYEYNYEFSFLSEEKRNFMGTGIGAAIGGKMVSGKGWIAEMVGGLGWDLFNTKDSHAEIYPRLGINIGKRF